ncbi:protein of unknown function DUF101 [Thermocrinis albus DSM 14484]|uniref:Archease domain-containing protein n=1 Tax=Thermocrinis albus (strain DSM 14484 / JCM 11386 / HI 11/12) TaxID=638303 RepID=D3SLK8_THEAH|nr:archease [Thermocrinis albus]ADC89638.1 protein of unknown function DUF101 [Thermocrinis albus DSM 14484]
MSFYESIDDITADAGIRVRGSSVEEVICKAILATFNEITNIEVIEPEEEYILEVRSSLPYSLADIINEALVLHESKGFVAKECHVLELKEHLLRVKLKGGRFDPAKNESRLVIKAATYHRLRLEKEDGSYVAEVIFDI